MHATTRLATGKGSRPPTAAGFITAARGARVGVLWAALMAAPLHAADPQLLHHLFSEERSFYLDSKSDARLLEHDSPREVRVCSDPRGHRIPLQVQYDGKRANVLPGGCICFEAKTVIVKPDGPLTLENDISGTVAHRTPQSVSSAQESATQGVHSCPRRNSDTAPSGVVTPNPGAKAN